MSGNPAYNRLLNLLHAKSIAEARPKVAAVKRVLYDHAAPSYPAQSILDDLMKKRWEQQPLKAAIAETEQIAPHGVKSNVLVLNCPMAHVGRVDLHNIYPRINDRRFALPQALRDGPRFHVVKARNPVTLLFAGCYYLVFANYNQGCAYYLESRGKLINGFGVDLRFVHPNVHHLKHMGSSLLHSRSTAPVANFEVLSQTYKQRSYKEVFAESAPQCKIIAELEKIDRDRSAYCDLDQDPLFDLLEYFMDIPSRYSLVVVRNLPFGITRPVLYQLLWNYEFATAENPQDSMRLLHSDPGAQVTVVLLHFKDEVNARRFVRNYHGRHWDKMIKIKLKALYEPIRCEIVD